MKFVHESRAQRVRFDSVRPAEAVTAEVELLGSQRVMVIASEFEASLAERVTAGVTVAVRHDEVVMHVPVEVAERARKVAAEHGVDALVCVGGGSTTGL